MGEQASPPPRRAEPVAVEPGLAQLLCGPSPGLWTPRSRGHVPHQVRGGVRTSELTALTAVCRVSALQGAFQILLLTPPVGVQATKRRQPAPAGVQGLFPCSLAGLNY
ncbi:unnamed protein product [Rangifer tarandus platyrhynchus]|uniref:Uncharacterized protein n=1 Tax=Rangifer tarandus platyrhynchus TaxID=3082113 RepID=A0AC60A6H0_RANTA